MRKPMTVDYALTSYHRHHMKPVLAERTLDAMESMAGWELVRSSQARGYGNAEPAQRDGRPVLRLTSEVISNQPNKTPGRGWGSVTLRRNFPGEDWQAYNRIALEVYPDLPGFRTVSLCMVLYNRETASPDAPEEMKLHFVVLKNHAWNHVYWEIPELNRDRITGIGLQYRLQSAEPGADTVVTYDFADLRLQRVDPDHTLGWVPKPGEICFSHVGYTPDASKTAIASGLAAKTFDVISCSDDNVCFTGPVRQEDTPIGSFQVLDFTPLNERGRYFIKAGDVITPPFAIGPDVWRSSIEKILNFYYVERCGFPVPGVHDTCHGDLLCRHGNQTKVLNGGWHDAGDLSQELVNSVDSVCAMMRLADSLEEKDAHLRERILEEARWGQEWVLKTRFTDGYRATWLTMDYWSDGVLGTLDDVVFDATRNAYDNFISAISEALAARIWKEEDPAFALRNLKAAREDFAVADEDKVSQPGYDPVGVYSLGVSAAVELYKTTGCADYLAKAVEYARTVLACQQTEPMELEIPLRGFFYTDETHKNIVHHQFPHRNYEHLPIVALDSLLAALPGHEDAPRWRQALALYGEYVKAIAKYSAPYFMPPAGIYSIEDVEDIATRGKCSAPEALNQIRKGIRLGDSHYIRLFPVWGKDLFRGNSALLLSRAVGALTCAMTLKDKELLELARRALEWHVGRNPFNQSLIWGEGYNFTTRYTAMCGDIVGSFPVGVQAPGDDDIPYFPDSACYTYKEIWVRPAAFWLWLMAIGGRQLQG